MANYLHHEVALNFEDQPEKREHACTQTLFPPVEFRIVNRAFFKLLYDYV